MQTPKMYRSPELLFSDGGSGQITGFFANKHVLYIRLGVGVHLDRSRVVVVLSHRYNSFRQMAQRRLGEAPHRHGWVHLCSLSAVPQEVPDRIRSVIRKEPGLMRRACTRSDP